MRKWDAIFFSLIPQQLTDLFIRAFVASFSLYVFHQYANATESLSAAGFRFNSPVHNLPLAPVPRGLIPLLAAISFACCTVCFLLPRSKLALGGALLTALYTDLADTASSFTVTKLFVVTFTCLLFRPTGGSRAGLPEGCEPVWLVRALQLVVVALYLASGVCKCVQGDWLSDPLILHKQLQMGYSTRLSEWTVRVVPREVWPVLAYAALAFELASPVIFTHPRTQRYAVAAGLAFHTSLSLLMNKLILFSLPMMAFYLVLGVPWAPTPPRR